MFQRKPSRFRRNNGRGHTSHRNGHSQSRPRPNAFANNQTINNFRPTQSAEKLFEKYSTLAKEAMSSGDKTLSENYLQHADHFIRVIEDKNKNRIQTKSNNIDKPIENTENSIDTSNNTQKTEEIKNKD